jgi:tetratricopeptide (TPR) repeat protein
MTPRTIPVFVLLLAGVCLAAEPEPTPSPSSEDGPVDRLLDTYYMPPPGREDDGLYLDTARLQKLLLLMPDRIDRSAPEDAAAEAGPGGAKPETPVEALEVAPPAGQGWQKALDAPVVGPEQLAWTCYRAERYEEAVELYRGMLERDERDDHARFMLFLCLRNLGRREAARKLHNELPQDSEVRRWASWTLEIEQMVGKAPAEASAGTEQTGAPVGETNATPTKATSASQERDDAEQE